MAKDPMLAGFDAAEAVIRSGVDPGEGLAVLCKRLNTIKRSAVWGKIAALDAEGDGAKAVKWFSGLLKKSPPGASIKAYWFGLFESERGAVMYVAGATRYRKGDNQWAVGPAWFPEGRYAKSKVLEGIYAMPRKAGEKDEVVSLADYALQIGYGGLLAAHAVRGAGPGLVLGKSKSRMVGVGFDSGDCVELGKVTGRGLEITA